MRICTDCKHFSEGCCVRGRQQVGVDPVYGMPEYKFKAFEFAVIERESIMPWRCGKRGRFFEQKS